MSRSRTWILGLLIASTVSCTRGEPPDNAKVEVVKPDVQDVSPPLSELAKLPVPEVVEPHEAEPARAIPHMRLQSGVPVHDPVVQTAIGGPNIPSTTVNFEGMGAGLAGFTVLTAPPNTDGDIGPNHYVQIVNSGVTIFNRAGTPVLGPVLTRTFFTGFAGACATTNDGDGVVRYDRIADRWVIAQFSTNGGNGPFFQCVAVSTSPDPTGTYNRFQFSYPALNDYPKMGLWPDGYYTTFNMFPNNVFGGAKVCAYDRVKMLTGAAATQQCFDTSNQFGGLLASDLDGPTLPPAGSPNFIGAIDTTAIDFWKMHVDFTTPANSTFVGPTMIPVAAYSPLCGGGTCVVQKGTAQQLDSLADRAMNRFVYRNYGDHEALLMSHSVTAGAGGGVRFYELRSPATTPTIFQQGTYAPDAAFRWMSSMAFDSAGDIAMGFSISSSTINPSIRYTGRLVADAPGTMGQGEATIVAGTGSQTGSNLSGWGAYSSMNIDPTDDCTFWFTTEYMGASGVLNWHTRVGAFKFPGCGQAPPNQAPTVAITAPANGATVSGTAVPVTATATDSDGSVMSVRFDLPDGTNVTDTTAPYSTTFDSTKVADGGGYMIRATATDNLGATSASTMTVTVANGPGPSGCVNDTFSAQDAPIAIRDNDPLGITSSLPPVTCTGTIKSLSLSLNITHTYRGDLVVTLISPGGTQFSISNRAGGTADNIIVTNMAITTFNGQTAAGSWKLQVEDLAPADTGILNSWSMTITSN